MFQQTINSLNQIKQIIQLPVDTFSRPPARIVPRKTACHEQSAPQSDDKPINLDCGEALDSDLLLAMSRYTHHVNQISFILGQLLVIHCAFSFYEKNSELYQLTIFSRKLRLLSKFASR